MSPGCSPRAPQNILGWVVSREARQSDPGALWCQGPARTAFRCAPSNASSPLLGFSSLPPPSPQRRLPRAGWAKGLQFLPRWGNRCPGTRTVHSFPLPVRVRDTQRSRSKGLSRVVRGAPSSTASWWGTPSGGWLSDLEGDGERRYGLGAGRESRLVGPRGWAATRGHLLGTGSSTPHFEIQLVSHHQQFYKIKKNRSHQSAVLAVKETCFRYTCMIEHVIHTGHGFERSKTIV